MKNFLKISCVLLTFSYASQIIAEQKVDETQLAAKWTEIAKKSAEKAGFKHFQSENPSVNPKPKIENDGYSWYDRFQDVMNVKDKINPQIVMIGDSITHFFGGEPVAKNRRGQKVWQELYGSTQVLNLGFGWDRIQNAIFRIHAGQIDKLRPNLIIVNIGTNNTTGTKNAKTSTAEEMQEAYTELFRLLQHKAPKAKIVAMEIFPRDLAPNSKLRILNSQYNESLRKVVAKMRGIELINLSDKF
ncbi:MAG: GDSL-type esterase/lipase family protein, partial [Lentisphaeria bacterium]